MRENMQCFTWLENLKSGNILKPQDWFKSYSYVQWWIANRWILSISRLPWERSVTLSSFHGSVVNRPRVAGDVLQTPVSLTDWSSEQSFSFKSLKHHKSQTNRARDLTFLHNVHHVSHVMCHVSHVMCHLSHVICHVSIYLYIYIFYKLDELVSGGSAIIGAPSSSDWEALPLFLGWRCKMPPSQTN